MVINLRDGMKLETALSILYFSYFGEVLSDKSHDQVPILILVNNR